MRILIVEDQAALRLQLKINLTDAGYAVDQAEDCEEGLFIGTEYPIDVAVIDLGLPKMNGIELISKLRDEGKSYPIIILTARNSWQEKVEGLEAGADDYLVKPFQTEELLARINALLRRSRGFASPTLKFGDLQINTHSKTVSLAGNDVSLTAYEYKVLEYLSINPQKAISKTELVEHIYEEDSERDSNVVEVFIRRLRIKLDPKDTLKPIETVRGQGYRFVLKADEQ